MLVERPAPRPCNLSVCRNRQLAEIKWWSYQRRRPTGALITTLLQDHHGMKGHRRNRYFLIHKKRGRRKTRQSTAHRVEKGGHANGFDVTNNQQNKAGYAQSSMTRRTIMKSMKQRIRQMSVGGLLVWGVLALSPVQVQALQAIHNSENCKGGVPDGAFHCVNKPGQWVECIPSGDYMCCTKNDQGGKDCEQIEVKTTNPLGGVKGVQSGVLQSEPTKAPPKTSRVPKTGAKAPIMRRGIDEEGTDSPSSSSSDKP